MEMRKDYFLERYVIISAERGQRPHQFIKQPESKQTDICFFCPGNEHLTPPEIGRVADSNGWYIRWFENKYPAVSEIGDPLLKINENFFVAGNAYGKHEVIVESPKHEDELSDLSEKHIKELLYVYKARVEELSKIKGVRYVQIFKNHMSDAGASIPHTHSQIIAYNLFPRTIEKKLHAITKHVKCPYCRVADIESTSPRTAFLGKNFVAFTPFASRFPYEIWIMPRRHIKKLAGFMDSEFADLASMLKLVLMKLRQLNAPYNIVFNYSPEGRDLHFHIEILPRLKTWAGFELGTETIINPVSPEQAAEFYRS